jgi:2'-5' RNA ligase
VGETAIVIAVPEAEPAIEHLRRQHTTSGAEGVPPHVTLIYPFADSELLGAARLQEVAEVVSRFAAFAYRLVETARFTSVPPILYLVPEPAEPFCALISALADAFPEHPPYGGAYSESTPHVTVAEANDPTLDAIEAEVAPWLPISARAEVVSLLEHGSSGAWRLRRQLPLAPVRI